MKATPILLVTLLSLFTRISFGQVPEEMTQTIRGQILDVDTELPIYGAAVKVLGTDPIKGASTDLDGFFEIIEVPLGKYDIEVSYLGYERQVIPQVDVKSGRETDLTIRIIEAINTVGEVVIEAGRESDETVNELNLVSTKTFSVDETKRYAGSFNDPLRMVSAFAGVNGGDDDENNEIVIRGNSPRMLLWQLEGIEVPNPNHFTDVGSSSGAVSILSSQMLADSDFLTGAFAAEYGNALSGVFDIRMRRGNYEKREYTLEVGVLGVDFATEGPFKKGGRATYNMNYRYSALGLLHAIGLEVAGSADIRWQDLSFKINVPTAKAGQFSFFGLGGLSFTDDATDEGFIYKETFNSDLGIIGMNHRFAFNERTYLKTTAAFSATRMDYQWQPFDSTRNDFVLEDDERFLELTSKVQTVVNTKFNAQHLLRAGVSFTHQKYDQMAREYNYEDDAMVPDIDEAGNAMSMQGFVNWRYRINEKLTLNTGLSSMYFLFNDNYSIEPRASFQYRFLPNHSFSFGFGMHSRKEAIAIYLGQTEDENGQLYQANRNLDFTRAFHYVVGYQGTIAPDLTLKAELYYQDLYNVPIPADTSLVDGSAINFTSGYITTPLVNEGTGRNYGLELTIEKYYTRNYFILGTLSLFESKYTAHEGVERDSRYNVNYITNLSAGKDWYVGKRKVNYFTTSFKSHLEGGKPYTPILEEESRDAGYTIIDEDQLWAARAPAYWRLDLQFGFHWNKKRSNQEIKIDVQNALNQEHVIGYYFDTYSDKVVSYSSGSLIPVLSYKVEF